MVRTRQQETQKPNEEVSESPPIGNSPQRPRETYPAKVMVARVQPGANLASQTATSVRYPRTRSSYTPQHDSREFSRSDYDGVDRETPITSSRARRSLVSNGFDEDEPRRTRRQAKEELTRRSSVSERRITYHEFDADDDEGEPRRRVLRSHDIRRSSARKKGSEDPNEEGYCDMYTRVKRNRRSTRVKRDMYGMEIEGKTTEDNCTTDEEEEGESRVEKEGDENEESQDTEQVRRQYSLREKKPQRQLYVAPSLEPRKRMRNIFKETIRDSPMAKRRRKERRRRLRGPTALDSSEGSSESSASDSDEEKFRRRHARNAARLMNRCQPINFSKKDLPSVAKDRQKLGSSGAGGSSGNSEVMNLDKSVTFSSIGGLDHHIQSLKEMILFPLLYSEVFEQFKVAPPRGVLFHGPPGTGKTLVARALVNECSKGEHKVSFFMRKGTDCLSKWMGEAERQLRLLFDQAYQMRPSIIFFDEIDGLTPVRSGRMEQSHDSIVTTLLALMDGLDNRGEIVVIGATNRIDAIDPALRRPGRFDREFQFNLPTKESRKEILRINTKEWNPKLCDAFLEETAAKCAGYCGADLKALCSEAALSALRRRYPQIYASDVKLELDIPSIEVGAVDFHVAMKRTVPAGRRAHSSYGRPLSTNVGPLLQDQLTEALDKIKMVFPAGFTSRAASLQEPEYSNNSAPSIFQSKRKKPTGDEEVPSFYASFKSSLELAMTVRPRCILTGGSGAGQLSHLGPALVHALEHLPVHTIDLPAMYSYQSRTPEELCSHIFREAIKGAPSVVYMPHVDGWWSTVSATVIASLMASMRNIDPTLPVLVLATTGDTEISQDLRDIFMHGETILMKGFSEQGRYAFFEKLFLEIPFQLNQKKPTTVVERELEKLPVAAPMPTRRMTESERQSLRNMEEDHLTQLRVTLREVLHVLSREKKFGLFCKPVDKEDVPDYYEIISCPMNLSQMMMKIDDHRYITVGDFLADIELIWANALEYNPEHSANDKSIRHRACALKDQATLVINDKVTDEFIKTFEEIKESRKRRGEPELNPPPSPSRSKRGSDTTTERPIGDSGCNGSASISSRSVRFSRRLQTRGEDEELVDMPSISSTPLVPSRRKRAGIIDSSPEEGESNNGSQRDKGTSAICTRSAPNDDGSKSNDTGCSPSAPDENGPVDGGGDGPSVLVTQEEAEMSADDTEATSLNRSESNPVEAECNGEGSLSSSEPTSSPPSAARCSVMEKTWGKKCNDDTTMEEANHQLTLVTRVRLEELVEEVEVEEREGSNGPASGVNDSTLNGDYQMSDNAGDAPVGDGEDEDGDMNEMKLVLQETVRVTKWMGLDALETLHGRIYRLIYKRREDKNKSELVEDIYALLEKTERVL